MPMPSAKTTPSRKGTGMSQEESRLRAALNSSNRYQQVVKYLEKLDQESPIFESVVTSTSYNGACVAQINADNP